MKIKFSLFLVIVFSCFIFTSSFSQEAKEAEESEGKNEIAVFLGGTSQMSDDGTSAFTLGLDYQYRVGKLIGLGFLFDHAMGDIKSTLIGPFVSFHLRKFVLITAPALEFSDGETNPTFRLGLAYEIELSNGFAILPTLNYDNERRDEISIVYGFSIAKSF